MVTSFSKFHEKNYQLKVMLIQYSSDKCRGIGYCLRAIFFNVSALENQFFDLIRSVLVKK